MSTVGDQIYQRFCKQTDTFTAIQWTGDNADAILWYVSQYEFPSDNLCHVSKDEEILCIETGRYDIDIKMKIGDWLFIAFSRYIVMPDTMFTSYFYEVSGRDD